MPVFPAGESGGSRPAVHLADVGKVYRDQRVLTDITLDVAPGETFCIVGRNGSGKSTILEIVKGLKRQTSGEVRVLGRHPMDESLKEECAILTDRYVFPHDARVKEIVELHAGFYVDPMDPSELIELYQLQPEKRIRHLSRGQMQRLGTVLALLGRPRLVLLDEPTAALDPQGRAMLWDVLQWASARRGERTVVFVTHDMAEAERWADRIGVLHQGRLLTEGSPSTLFDTFIGTRRKLTFVGQPLMASDMRAMPGVRSVAAVGPETVLYTDDPHDVLDRIGENNGFKQVRIENVSLRDVYFRLTGETPHEPNGLSP